MDSEYQELEVRALCPEARWRIKYALSIIGSFRTLACMLILSCIPAVALCLLTNSQSAPLNFGFGSVSYHESEKPVELAAGNSPTNSIAATTITTTARPSAEEDEMLVVVMVVSASLLMIIALVVYAMCAPTPAPITIEDNTPHPPGYHHHTLEASVKAPEEEDLIVDPFLAKMRMDAKHRQNEKHKREVYGDLQRAVGA